MKAFTVAVSLFLFLWGVEGRAEDEVVVKLGEKVMAQELQITFVDVVRDSRCPEGAKCIWAGNAQVELQLEKKGLSPVVVKLNTGAPPKETTFGGYLIRLKTLDPRPKLKTAIKKTDYTLTVVVSQEKVPATAITSNQSPAKASVAAPVQQDYPVSTGMHWVGVVMERGAKVKLEDGSIWEISRKDQSQTMYWQVAQKINVGRGPDVQYPFKLTNTSRNATVDARLVSRP